MLLRHLSIDAIIEFVRSRITKEIQDCPELIPIVRRINQEAQLFFLKEVTKSSLGGSSKTPHENKASRKEVRLTPAESSDVKIEEEEEDDSSSPEVKEQEIEKPGMMMPTNSCLKQEEGEDVIWQKYD